MGNKNNLNVISTCSVAFLSISSAALLIYIAMILFGITSSASWSVVESPQIEYTKKGMIVVGLVLAFGSWLCSLLNRTKAVPNVSKNNWANSFFFFGLFVPFLAASVGTVLFFKNPSLLIENKWLSISLLASITGGCWMFLQPDLMPQECVPD